MDSKEFTIEIFEKALKIYGELPKEEKDLVIEALTMINRHSHTCELRAKRIVRGGCKRKLRSILLRKKI